MQIFALDVNGTQCTFDTDGIVTDAANHVFGKWTTTDDNKIKVIPASGSNMELAVDWGFNAQNQLTIHSGGTEVLTLRISANGVPRMHLEKNVLIVDPDGDSDFKFPLKCQFGMTAAGNLQVTFNGTDTHELDGYLSDSRSRFRYEFFDKDMEGSVPNAFLLSGEWVQDKSKATEIRMEFKLADPAQAIDGKALALPGQLKVEKHRNHLALVYEKNGATRRIQFLGSLEIKKGWKLAFRVDYESNGASKKMVVEMDTTFEFDTVEGGIKLYVGKTKTATSQEITVGGSLKAKFVKSGISLSWDFQYTKSTAGGKSNLTIATSLEFEAKGSKIIIKYKKDTNANTESLDVTAKIEKSDFVLSGGVAIQKDGDNPRRLGAFIGISF